MKRRNIIAYLHDAGAETPCDQRVDKIGRNAKRWVDVTCPRCIARRRKKAA